MVEETVTYGQIDAGGDPDPLGLEKKLRQIKAVKPGAPDPLGLEAKLRAAKAPQQPAFQVKIAEPTFRQKQESTLLQPGVVNEPIRIKNEEIAYIPDEKTIELEKLKGKAQEAHKKLHAELLTNDDKHEQKIREYRRDSYTIEDLRNDYKDAGQILAPQDEKRLLQREKQRRYEMPVTPEEISDAKTGTILDESNARKFLKKINSSDVSSNSYIVDKYNEIAGDPNALERMPKIKSVEKEIKSGRVFYDPEARIAYRPVGLIGSMMEGVKNKFKMDEKHSFYKNTENDAAIIKELEEERNNPDTDTPINVPKGEISEFVKKVSEMPILPMVAGAAGTIGGTLIGNPELGAVAATALGAYESRKSNYTSTYEQVYNEMRNQGANPFDALAEAKRQANNAQEIGTIVGAAQGLIGARISSYGIGYQKAVGDFLKKNGSELGKIVLEGAAQGGVGSAGEVVKNKLAQYAGIKRDLDSGVAEAFWDNVMMTAGIGLAIKGAKSIGNLNYKRVMHGLTKNVPDEVVNGVLSDKVQSGEITQEAADQAVARINEYKELDSQIPPNVTEDARFKIQDNIEKINKLEQEKEATHKSLQDPIKEKIQKLTEANLALSKEIEKPAKIESGLSKSQEKEAIETAEEFVAEGIVPNTYGEMIKKDPIGFWRMIAQQAQNRDENWRPLPEALPEEAVRDQFGDTVVDYAKELFPAPEASAAGPDDGYTATDWKSGVTDVISIDVPNMGTMELTKKGDNSYSVSDVNLNKELRNKGIGKRLYYKAIEELNKRGLSLEPGHSTSPEALRVWRVLEREGLAKIESVIENSDPDYQGDFVVKAKSTGKSPSDITIKPEEDAISIQEPDAMDVNEQAGDGQAMGQGYEQSESAPREEAQRQEDTTSGQEGVIEPPLPPAKGGGVFVEHPATQLSFRGLQDTANEFGFEDVRPRDHKSDLQTRVNAERTATEWASKGEYQSNIDEMLGKIERKEMVPTDEQRLILEQYLENEKQKARDIANKSSEEYNRQLQKVQRIKDIGKTARSEAAAALRIPDGGSRVHPINDEVDAMVAKMEANKVDQLTDQQKAEVKSQVVKYKQAADEANAKVAELEARVAELDSKKEFNKVKSTTKRIKKTAEERIAYRRSEVEAARKALHKLRTGESGLSAVPLLGVRELIVIAPHVKNIMVDLVAQGVDSLEDVVKHLHTEFKDVLEGISEKNIHDIIAGEYNEKPKPLSELQRQIRDIQDEAKYINQLEALLSGKEPKAERAKRERNRKIKDLKDKIKDFRKEEAASNKFYGESDAGEKKLDALRDELERIQNRREKEKPAKDSQADKEISVREKDLRDQIEKAQAEWDKEKESARQAKRDYERMETERNRQLQKVDDLKEKLENLQKGVKAKGKIQQKKQDTPEIESLKKQVSDAEKELNNTLATEKRIKGLEEELDRLKQRKDKEPKEVEKREITDRERELKEQINEERKAFRQEQAEADKFYKEELDEDAKKLIAIKKRNQKRAQEIREKISKGQFEKEVKKSIFDREDVKKNYPRLREDALDAIANKEEAQHEFDLALYKDEMEQRSRLRKGADLLGKVIHTSKAVMSGIDDSATFVQNGLVMLGNPDIAPRVWWNHVKDAVSDSRFKRELAAIHASPRWEIYKNSELEITEPHSAASKNAEEAFEKNLLAGKIKIKGEDYQPWKYTGGIFERAFVSLGNNIRVSLFDKRIDALEAEGKTFESHPKEYKDAARSINELTARGKVPQGLAQASPWITPFIWAPRMLTSTINVLGLSDLALGAFGKGYYQNLTPTQRKFALSQLGRGVGMGVAVMMAASFAGAKVDYDPRSVTFGDVIVGDHHYNVFGRYTPIIKGIVQFAMGERLKKGGAQDLDSGKRGAKTRMGVVGGFFRGKMTPIAGVGYDLAEGKNYFTNEPFTIKDVPAALITPMSIKELVEGWKNDGTWTLLNRFLPAFEGLKVSDERDFKPADDKSNSKKGIHKSPRGKQNKNIHRKTR